MSANRGFATKKGGLQPSYMSRIVVIEYNIRILEHILSKTESSRRQ